MVGLAAANAAGGDVPRAPGLVAPEAGDLGLWTRPLAPGLVNRAPALPAAAPVDAPAPDEAIDVVDAHWMALTMWGEARSGGEEAMRAVGHVIDNRRRLGRHGSFVTETVSEAWQFSCWNPGDPNREPMLNIDRLRRGTREHEMWLVAKRLAGEILSERSSDPTGGALFYHTTAVSPRWSRGVAPTTLIGGHLFFAKAG